MHSKLKRTDWIQNHTCAWNWLCFQLEWKLHGCSIYTCICIDTVASSLFHKNISMNHLSMEGASRLVFCIHVCFSVQVWGDHSAKVWTFRLLSIWVQGISVVKE
jgi:hypothetical protein